MIQRNSSPNHILERRHQRIVVPKDFTIEFPRLQQENHKSEYSLECENNKIMYRKGRVQKGIKSLFKSYDEHRKKHYNHSYVNFLELEVIKIQSVAPETPHNFKPRSQKTSSARVKLNLAHRRNASRVNQKDQIINTGTTYGTSYGKRVEASNYLYKKLEGTEKINAEELNVVYQKRIKSYMQFLWKLHLSHNLIGSRLDLTQSVTGRISCLKAYVGPGNNSAMVKGLIKRRFWWTISQVRTPDCQFIWTQIKVNSIFSEQQNSASKKPLYFKKKQQKEERSKDEGSRQQSKDERRNKETTYFNKVENPNQQFNYKLMHQKDREAYEGDNMQDGQHSYRQRSSTLCKQLEHVDDSVGVIHNHLEYNFYLGNKKALFHNMREYYSLIKSNVFEWMPLTFHIKKGFKDKEYNKFISYYQKRAKQVRKQEQLEEQGQIKTKKTRNIWIVKPGENTNQGRGITVIDEIYELDNIIKQASNGNQSARENTVRTFIVQMYMDRPLLYHGRKFDIRHYMLITNFYGIMRAYWYEEGYIRTSSYQFDIDHFEPSIHLTNDAIQKQYPEYGKYEPYNKLSYDQFQRYLDLAGKKRSFRSKILPEMKKMAADAARSVCVKIAPRNQLNNFQILGLDFMVDSTFRPWLIQINTNPCLDCSCPLLNRIIPYMLQQSFKLTLDLNHPPPAHYPRTMQHYAPLINLSTFKYELILDSQIEGDALSALYRKAKSNLSEDIGRVSDDEQFEDDGKEIKLDDYT